ncbi:hypothetical protein FH039_02570 [Thermococcus indicus]|uniref:Uncharacterized protein n=1 Tax=Thermococcus indicus TaxID=2586643 RepID=A0A4Y5SKP2_9EURY|nr:hypothetical protein [Thermococcus indicus]QDA30719.1 hypothetical protein FH039_02570 [Thermococcus indicus]
MGDSVNVVYETLGRYIDDLCGSIYLGTARGKAVFYGERAHPLTPTEDPLPFMNIFYSHGLIEITAVWGRMEKGAFMVRTAPSDMSYDRLSGTIELVFPAEGDGSIVVTLHGNAELARTLRDAVRACEGVSR